MSSKEYSLKFINKSKYASSLVSNARDKMSCNVTACPNSLKKNVVQPCFMTIWIFLGLWFMLKRFRKVVYGRGIGKLRGKSHLKVVLLRVGLAFRLTLRAITEVLSTIS